MTRSAAKQIVKRGAMASLALLPYGPGRLLFRFWLRRIAAQEPRLAVRRLLEVDDDLTELLNEAAARYGNGVHVKHRLMRYHDFFVNRIKRGERVLDVGCGKGELAYDIAVRAGGLVTAIDTNRTYLAFARARFSHPDVTHVETDALTYQPADAFDVVVLSNILEHVEERVAFLKRIDEQVRPSRLLIRVPSYERDWRVPLRKELGLPYFSDQTHYTEYTVESFDAEMRQAGLAVTRLECRWGEIWAEVTPR